MASVSASTIDYIRESRQLGSAGALRLAREQLEQPFIVINADLLTNVNLSALMRFHAEDDNLITVGVRRYVSRSSVRRRRPRRGAGDATPGKADG